MTTLLRRVSHLTTAHPAHVGDLHRFGVHVLHCASSLHLPAGGASVEVEPLNGGEVAEVQRFANGTTDLPHQVLLEGLLRVIERLLLWREGGGLSPVVGQDVAIEVLTVRRYRSLPGLLLHRPATVLTPVRIVDTLPLVLTLGRL